MGKLYLVCFGISTKTLKDRYLKNCVFRKFHKYAAIHPTLLGLSQAIYGKLLLCAKSHEKYLNVEKKIKTFF